MTTQALYNKWRGQTFGALLGQEHITRTLQNQIRADRVGHAYLFTGLRGTGKTSTARIMAKAVNCVGDTDMPPCNECDICRSITAGRALDLIEIDAASNRGIDEIRDLRDRVAFVPHQCRFKVYVIDEVHMLTNEAFNALLKTLEEPPPHVIFILCTTEPHRLPDTILSRCQRFDFRRGTVADIEQELNRICGKEGLDVTPEALALIARRGAGSFRDAVSLLDQLSSYGSHRITPELIESVLGTVPSLLVTALVESLVTGQISQGLQHINDAIGNGAEPRQYLNEILEQLRAMLLFRVGGGDNVRQLGPQSLAEIRRILDEMDVSPALLVRAIKHFNAVGQGLRLAERAQLPFELAFIETVLEMEEPASTEPTPRARPAVVPQARAASRQPEERAEAPAPDGRPDTVAETRPAFRDAAAPATVSARAPLAAEPEQTPTDLLDRPLADDPRTPQAVVQEPVAPSKPAQEPAVSVPALSLDWVRNNWNLVMTKMRSQNRQIHALLNSAYPSGVDGSTVALACEGSFHRDRLMEDKRREQLEAILSEVLGGECHVQCHVGDVAKPSDNYASVPPRSGLFDTPDPNRVREDLANHPVVKELEKRGGRISKISVDGENDTGGDY